MTPRQIQIAKIARNSKAFLKMLIILSSRVLFCGPSSQPTLSLLMSSRDSDRSRCEMRPCNWNDSYHSCRRTTRAGLMCVCFRLVELGLGGIFRLHFHPLISHTSKVTQNTPSFSSLQKGYVKWHRDYFQAKVTGWKWAFAYTLITSFIILISIISDFSVIFVYVCVD